MSIDIQTTAKIEPMPSTDYHALAPHVSQTMLKEFAERRRLYEGYYVTKSIERPKPTKSMDTGTASHAMCLEPNKLIAIEIPWELLSNGAVRTNEAKKWVEDQRAEGRIPLKLEEYQTVMRVRDSFRNAAKGLLELQNSKVHIEHAVTWTDEETGLLCKARPDWVVERKSKAFVLDLKTCQDASPEAFAKSMANFSYGIQRAHYIAGVSAALGGKPCEFYFVACETVEPFASVIYHAVGDGFDKAELRRARLMRELAECRLRNDFREPWEGVVNELDLPYWAEKE